MKNYSMTQCSLVRKNGNKIISYVAWIPTVKAKIGKTVKIDNVGTFKIESCGNIKMSNEVINDSIDFKKHRKATDI